MTGKTRSLKTLHFARHGQSEANVARVIASQSIDSPLTPLGIAQAETAAEQAQQLNIDQIISSPLKRAFDTAVIIADKLAIDPETIIVHPELTEREAGTLTGQPVSAWKTIGEDYQANGAESLEQLYRRVQGLLSELLEGDLGENILLVSHNGFGRMLRVVIADQPAEEFQAAPRFPNAELFSFELTPALVHTKVKGRGRG